MSTALIIILSILFLGFLFLLFTPVYLVIDSEKGLYKIGVRGIANARIQFTDLLFELHLRVLFFQKRIDPLNYSKTKKKETGQKKTKKPSSNKKSSGRPNLEAILTIFKSFKLQQFNANIDTGDYPLNAQLIPLSVALNQFNNVDFNINFENINVLKIYIENNAWHLLMSFIKSKYSTKN